MKPVVVVTAPFQSVSGYGKKALDFCRSILRIRGDEWDIKFVETGWASGGRQELHPTDPIIVRQIKSTDIEGIPNVVLHVGLPDETIVRGELNILLTSGTETTTVPMRWLALVDSMWDGVIVPSQFTADQFARPQIKTPIHVVCEGVEPVERSEYFSLRDVKESFCFLFVGQWLPGKFGEDRKNVSGLIETFMMTFANKVNSPALLLKTSLGHDNPFDRNDVMHQLTEIRDIVAARPEVKQLPPVYLLHGEISDPEMQGLYANSKVKAMVSLTKGEAVGRPLLEFAMHGKPVITTSYSAPKEFLGKSHMLLPYTLKNVHPTASQRDILTTNQQWGNVDLPQAQQAMLATWKKYPLLAKAAEQHKAFLKKNYSLKAMDAQLDVALKSLVPSDFSINLPQY